ncbi:MAG: transglutaminase domain-containing protein [Lentisphaeria bacterium]|nr:transglutaminase domain-containing protein [Lentisphaeria bacterium]
MIRQRHVIFLLSCLVCQYAVADIDALKKRLPKEQHKAADFLFEHMPERDRQLTVAFLAENVDYAYRAREKFPWARDVPDDLFLNWVLPYASLDESRDPWRKKFFEMFGDTVMACGTAGEAAITLNTTIYDTLNVHYSKQRPKANQSPAESIKAGKASCTGLSILLVNACRSVGIPARVVGTPLWVKGGGNHTWVEIWDKGWHSVGAAESKALNRTWFAEKASEQVGHDPRHAIYAASFKKTETPFPLVWAPAVKHVSAVNVTANYAADKAAAVSLDDVKKALSGKTLSDLLARLHERDMRLSLDDDESVRDLIWRKHVEEMTANKKRLEEHSQKAVSYDGLTMRYAYKIVGERPKDGYALYIALHGGGGAPPRVNDSQWQQMKTYYLNGVTNGIYLAPRGVNNEWNLHWREQSFVCYDRIIENMIAYEGVNPNRVYLMGYSAGGDAAYQIPARMPDRWAAVAMSAGHPNGVPVDNYANLAFLIQVGEKDTAYKRHTVAAEYGVKLDKLEKTHPGLYTHATYIHAGRGHGFMDHGLKEKTQAVFTDPAAWLAKNRAAETSEIDCHSIRWLDKHERNPLPSKIIWDRRATCDRSGNKDKGFWPSAEKSMLHYWLGIDRYDKDSELDARRIVVEIVGKNRIHVKEIGHFVRFYLSPDLFDLENELIVEVEGRTLRVRPNLSLKTLVESLLDRGDPNFLFPASLTLSRNPEGTWMLE